MEACGGSHYWAREIALQRSAFAVDITFLWTEEGWVYLVVGIDQFSRQIVGFAISERTTRRLLIDALRMAWVRRRPTSGLIFHSD
jgi:transposase InsO family protein